MSLAADGLTAYAARHAEKLKELAAAESSLERKQERVMCFFDPIKKVLFI